MSFNPGDIIIYEALLSGIPGTVDILPRILNFDVWENIKKPYTIVTITIVDNADMLNKNLGLDGKNNSLQLAFSQPGQRIYTGTWAITSIEKGVQLASQRTQVYKLTGYSPHMANPQNFPKVQQAFKGMTATDVVQSLVGKYLPGLIKPLVIDAPSRGPLGNDKMPYNINGIQIWKAIRSTLLRGSSTKDPSSAYVMFENRDALKVDTLENLVNKAVATEGSNITFFQRPMGKNFLLDVANQPLVIIALKEESRSDRTTTVQNDNQANRIFDIFGNAFSATGEKGASTYNNIPYNSLRPRTFAPDFLDLRKKVAGEFDSQSVTVQVSLNTDVTVGEGFNVETLAPAGDTETPVPDNVAGPLLAVEVRHSVRVNENRMQGTTTARGVRGTQ